MQNGRVFFLNFAFCIALLVPSGHPKIDRQFIAGIVAGIHCRKLSPGEENMEILITPKMDDSRFAHLSKQAQMIEWAIDPEHHVQAKPIGQSGILQQVGAMLWQASGLDAQAVRDAIETAKDNDDSARFIITGEDYQHLPWEMLYHEHPDIGFLSFHSRCSVIRRISGQGKPPQTALAKPFRLLLFISSPEGLDPEKGRLDFEKEEELLFTALDDSLRQKLIDIDVAEDGCFDTLIRRLETKNYHAVILSMHGTSAKNSKGIEEWGLLFEEKDTYAKAPVAGSDLAIAIENLPKGHRPGLIVLSACRSAKVEQSSQSLSSTAIRLHSGGVERVLGMRLSVWDKAASVFNAELFRRLSLGETVSRAVSLARNKLTQDEQFNLYAQWSLPVLLDRTADSSVVDTSADDIPEERPALPTIMDGDNTIFIPQRTSFIGRRREIREFMRNFLEGRTRCLMFAGAGGIGKTTLAGLFARTLAERKDNIRILGFTAPFDLNNLFEPLRKNAFDGEEEDSLKHVMETETDIRERIRRLLLSLAKRKSHPLALILDNLEILQNTDTLKIADEQSLWLIKTVCELPAPARILLTGRYAIPELPQHAVSVCQLKQAPYADILRRLERLHIEHISRQDKSRMYEILGGNHRAVEWMAQLMNDADNKAKLLIAVMEKLDAPANTPEEKIATVIQAMREDLLFDTIRKQLTPAQDRLLCAAALYRVSVNEDGLRMIDDTPPRNGEGSTDDHDNNRKRLVDYSLLEKARDAEWNWDCFMVPPVVKSLLKDGCFDAEELKIIHEKMGRYHRFQGKNVSKIYQDYIEAVYHFRIAGKHVEADELAEDVAGFYYRISSFAEANQLAKDIVERKEPPAPWWALNRYGMCQAALGFYDEALAAYQRALPIVPNKKNEGTTLNNISLIFKARGDYDTALKYLKQSLAIRREIGDKSGEGRTLSNISGIYQNRGDYDSALSYLEQSLELSKKIGDKICESRTLNNINKIYYACGDYDTAQKYIEQSLDISKEIGDKEGEGLALNNISTIAYAHGDYDTALEYLEQSLAIRREIGDKSGMANTLHNMGHIAKNLNDMEKAFSYWSEAFQLAMETQNAQGLFNVGKDFGNVLSITGNKEQARQLLTQAVQVGRQAGFPDVQKVEALLQQLDAPARAEKHPGMLKSLWGKLLNR